MVERGFEAGELGAFGGKGFSGLPVGAGKEFGDGSAAIVFADEFAIDAMLGEKVFFVFGARFPTHIRHMLPALWDDLGKFLE